jgi:hypothetical protein
VKEVLKMKKFVGSLAAAAMITGVATAGEVSFNLPVAVHDGFSAGYSYADSTAEGFEVTNFLVELSKDAKDGIGFTAAFGYLPSNGASTTGDNFGFQYGYLTVAPMEGITLDAGVLATMVGYEVANTYANPNITIARIWSGQPVYYGGARATYALGENAALFAEINDDGKDGAWSIGGTGSFGNIDVVASYYDKSNPSETDIVDLILSANLGGFETALNFDYQIGKNDNGYGLAFYITPKLGMIDVPVRIEYFDDNGSGAYNGNKGWDLAVTPTVHFSENGYVRAEVFYYNYDNPEGITGSDAASSYTDDSNTVFRVEFGYTF